MTLRFNCASASFKLVLGRFKQRVEILQQINVKNVHPVSGAGIRAQ